MILWGSAVHVEERFKGKDLGGSHTGDEDVCLNGNYLILTSITQARNENNLFCHL